MAIEARRKRLPDILTGGTHAGLLLSRYLKHPAKPKDEAFNKARGDLILASQIACKNTYDLYLMAFKKWAQSFPDPKVDKSIEKKILEVDGRMVTGLGSESSMETGLRLHHVYGTPLIPGSALKGLAAHYSHTVWGETDKEFRSKIENEENRPGKHFEVLIGTNEDAGHIIFHDSWIRPESLKDCLVPDVMTVHHPKYYQGEDSPPGDFDDPTPIPFLSVRGKFSVVLTLDVNDGTAADSGKKWLELTMNLLMDAVKYWGIGGKTNSGYGRLK